MADNIIFNPVKEYQNYKDKHLQIVNDYFEELTKKSQIDLNQNKQQVAKINQTNNRVITHKKSLRKFKILAKITLIIAFLFLVVVIYFTVKFSSSAQTIATWTIIFLTISAILFAGLLLVYLLEIRPKIKQVQTIILNDQIKYDQQVEIGVNQVKDLIDLIGYGTKEKLFSQSFSLIKFNRFLGVKNLNRFQETYLDSQQIYNDDFSCLNIKSGLVYHTPFLINRSIYEQIESKTYTGTLTISWEEQDGDQTITMTEILTASVVKPLPVNYYQSSLALGIEIAPNLEFSRSSSNFHNLSEKEKTKKYQKTEKQLYKYAERNLDFSPLANTKFETAFAAFNRKNDKEFRLMFTPLAQNNLMQLIEDNTYGFGDNFIMFKISKALFISSSNLDHFEINDNLLKYYTYDYNEIKNTFIKDNANYFDQIYWLFAPFFAIPTLSNSSSETIIFNNNQTFDLTVSEVESQVWSLSKTLFDHELVKTDSLLKAVVVDQKNHLYEIHSKGYDIVKRTDFIPVLGDDGWWHDVPVIWDDYVEYQKITKIKLTPFKEFVIDDQWKQKFGSKLTDKQYITDLAIIEFLD
ncbi:MAG1210 family protein [Mycoplasma putrefaciens]|uniref:Uncharacterized protein n=1 Tax=Mycoplasma putrefaciens (strain ATCC 15718 / NCTC 10155 / C30 KS-1 / KS-1) TaxID=743965 RepID=A0A7U3ZSH9_MYCPK|nr:hypothetical protein [Mycoplasma putrefaciens]AEM68678.1 uncharacterized protein MPUT_0300 [Mycoplasma putrefaciens KS1]